MKKILLVVVLTVALSGIAAYAQEDLKLDTEIDKFSYVIGQNLGKSLSRDEIEINLDVLFQSIRGSYEGKESLISEEDSIKILTDFQQRIRTQSMARMKREAEENKSISEKFLADNAKKDGVIVTESGLQYKIIAEGTGETPKVGDNVKAHYRGTFVDGKEFDSSYKRNQPFQFTVGKGVIPGWSEVIQLMKPGSKYEVYIPANLAYGEAGRPPSMPGNATLIFEMELLEVAKSAPVEFNAPPPMQIQ